MDNNSIMRRLRYAFDFDDQQVIEIFGTRDGGVTLEQVRAWLKREGDPELVPIPNARLIAFLDGFITLRRGERPGPPRAPDTQLNNNIVLRKLKIALDLHSDDMLRLLALGDMPVSKPELGALFRREGHKHYRECQDQLLRKFLVGIQREYRPD